MTKDRLIQALEKMQLTAELGTVAQYAVSAVRNATLLSIDSFDEINSVDRESLLGTYRSRQARLKRTGGAVKGFDETIASLERQQDDRVIILIVRADHDLITVVALPSGSFIGCYIGKEAKLDAPPH